MTDTIRIFCGTEPKARVMERVLRRSILTNTKAQVDFVPMIGDAWEYSTEGFRCGTGFSLRRWMIPAACGFKGRAIYLDADQLLFGDIAELWAKADQNPGPAAWMTYQPSKFSKTPHPNSSVMVIDCEKAKDQPYFHIDAVIAKLRKDPAFYPKLMYPEWMTPAPGKIEDGWNHLNAHSPGKTKLLHYTKEPEQPVYQPDHPLAGLWQAALHQTINAGEIAKAEFEYALAQWDVKQDWRSTNGLHPWYKQYLPLFDEVSGI